MQNVQIKTSPTKHTIPIRSRNTKNELHNSQRNLHNNKEDAMKLRLWWLTLLLVSGCATTALTVEDAKRYANLNLNQFLTKRFADRQSRNVGGTIRYEAYFNSASHAQLARPTTELVNFCKAQGGNPKHTVTYTGDPFAAYRVSPSRVVSQTAAYARMKGISSDVALAASADMLEQAQRNNQAVDAHARVFQRDLYGEWNCDGTAQPWRAEIVPVSFTPHAFDAADMMVIEIRPR